MTESSTVEYRSFQPGDSAAIVRVWNAAAPQDGITPRRFRDWILLDRNFEAAGLQVALVDGEIVGAGYGLRRRVALRGDDIESGKGWISFLVVHPQHQGRGIGGALLDRTMAWLASVGVQEVRYSDSTPNYVLPGLDAARYPIGSALFASRGFEVESRPSAMALSLRGYETPAEVAERREALVSAGWFFGNPSDDDLIALIQVAEEFNPDWPRVLRETVLGGLPLERIVIAKDPTGALLGWAMHGTYDNVIDRFGPYGVLTTSRGTGLGTVLLHVTLTQMAAMFAQTAWFLWADEGSAAARLYAKHGFEITRTFDILRAVLPDGAASATAEASPASPTKE